ncbi:ferredoxin [Amycolatopsis pigmentata]|uniref:Ferredoxin n=1 Tax=Amycolatopsis pigmentata TaxID=450801 RepID=A0ABW5FLH8_9PSEU
MSGRIRVDRAVCDHHGQCTYTAATLFWFDGDGELAHVPELTGEQFALARDAAAACPVRAIRIED